MKIAFFVQHMLCGGVENALIALTKELINNGHKVDVYVIKKKGEFIDRLPKGVRLLSIPMAENVRNRILVGGIRVSIREAIEKKKILQALDLVINYIRYKNIFSELSLDLNKIPELSEKYDIAVNYHMHSPFLVWYLSERVSSEKKYTWIHNDFVCSRYPVYNLKNYLKCNDRFFGVSRQIIQEFVRIFPEYTTETEVALNIIPVNDILYRSMKGIPDEFLRVDSSKLKLLTVGRIEEQKGYDLALEACLELINSGYRDRFVWYVLGDGTQLSELERQREKYGLEKHFQFLGVKMNPYPYFKNCDIYVQTSKHEGWGLTLSEAKIFNKPIVTTDFAGAKEQIVNGGTGTIVEINAHAIYKGIKEMIDNPQKRLEYSKQLSEESGNYDTSYVNRFFAAEG